MGNLTQIIRSEFKGKEQYVALNQKAEFKSQWPDLHARLVDFWTGLLERSNEKTSLFSNASPRRYRDLSLAAGKPGVTFMFTILKYSAICKLYVDHDKGTGEGNKAIFDALKGQQVSIEQEFGGPLKWERMDRSRACRIEVKFGDGGWASPETWPHLQDKMIEAMIRLEKTFRPRLAEL